ncbi:hypothetical protein ACFVH6_36090 [Spirillospora sp. NPDC127200]
MAALVPGATGRPWFGDRKVDPKCRWAESQALGSASLLLDVKAWPSKREAAKWYERYRRMGKNPSQTRSIDETGDQAYSWIEASSGGYKAEVQARTGSYTTIIQLDNGKGASRESVERRLIDALRATVRAVRDQ